jgi:hypothetical protein
MFSMQSLLYRNQLSEQGRRKQCEAAGAAISKGHLACFSAIIFLGSNIC